MTLSQMPPGQQFGVMVDQQQTERRRLSEAKVMKATDWSSLEDEAKAESRGQGPECKIKTILDTIDDPKIRKMVQGVIEDVRISASAVHRALVRRLGESDAPTGYVIRHHRRGDCRCGKAVQ